MVEPHETHKAVAAENGHHCHMAGALQAPLEVFIRAGWMRGIRTVSRMAMDVCSRRCLKRSSLINRLWVDRVSAVTPVSGAFLVGELGPLVQHQHVFDLRAGNKEKLLVPVRGKLLEALVQE
jgi:hypothetical protein